MFTRNGVQYEFHHLGVPTQDVKPNERYNSQFGIYTSDSDCGIVRIQWHRFDADSCVDPVLRMLPHPAFKGQQSGGCAYRPHSVAWTLRTDRGLSGSDHRRRRDAD